MSPERLVKGCSDRSSWSGSGRQGEAERVRTRGTCRAPGTTYGAVANPACLIFNLVVRLFVVKQTPINLQAIGCFRLIATGFPDGLFYQNVFPVY